MHVRVPGGRAMTTALNVDEIKTLPPLDTLPPKHQKLVKKVARRLVLLENAQERGSCLHNFMGLVRDTYMSDPGLLPECNLCDPPALQAEANTRAMFLASLAMREAGALNERLAKAGAA